MNANIQNLKKSLLVKSFAIRFVLSSLAWLILVGGQLGDLWFVILCLAITTTISLYCIPPGQWVFRPMGVVRFIPYFLLTALHGGWDVARRVFFRTVPIDPGFITVEHDTDPRKTLILTWVISLLPGTASCVIKDETIIVHVLDKTLPVHEEIKELQKRIHLMFAEMAHYKESKISGGT